MNIDGSKLHPCNVCLREINDCGRKTFPVMITSYDKNDDDDDNARQETRINTKRMDGIF
jgi:deoxycytidylate deaminase